MGTVVFIASNQRADSQHEGRGPQEGPGGKRDETQEHKLPISFNYQFVLIDFSCDYQRI